MVSVCNCCLPGCRCPGLVSVENDVDVVDRVRFNKVSYHVFVIVDHDVVILFCVPLDRGD